MSLFSKVKEIFKGSGSVKRKKVYHNVIVQDPNEVWNIHTEIGDGAYGKVYKAQHIVNGTMAALKKVPLEEEEDLDSFMVEIDILSECQHENVVRLIEAYHWEGCLWMYLEYCDGGAVDSIMVDLDRPLTEPQISYICYNLLKALDYIHQQKVIHRDMKAGNVLLTAEGGVKLADFGVSAKNKNTMDKRGTFIGTPYWLAPEVIQCETFIDSKYDYKADIWSLGITLIEFAQMDPPHHEVSPLRVLLKISKSEPPKLEEPNRFSKQFNDFIASCLIKEPEHRPDAKKLLQHPFVNGKQSPKDLLALLIEYQADVVEEDVDDDHRTSRLSIDSDPSNSSAQDTSANSTLTLQSGDSRQKEGTPTSITDRKGKGPAPPPPTQPKKNPAPAVPSSGTTPSPLTTPTQEKGLSTTQTISDSSVIPKSSNDSKPSNDSKLDSIVEMVPVDEKSTEDAKAPSSPTKESITSAVETKTEELSKPTQPDSESTVAEAVPEASPVDSDSKTVTEDSTPTISNEMETDTITVVASADAVTDVESKDKPADSDKMSTDQTVYSPSVNQTSPVPDSVTVASSLSDSVSDAVVITSDSSSKEDSVNIVNDSVGDSPSHNTSFTVISNESMVSITTLSNDKDPVESVPDKAINNINQQITIINEQLEMEKKDEGVTISIADEEDLSSLADELVNDSLPAEPSVTTVTMPTPDEVTVTSQVDSNTSITTIGQEAGDEAGRSRKAAERRQRAPPDSLELRIDETDDGLLPPVISTDQSTGTVSSADQSSGTNSLTITEEVNGSQIIASSGSDTTLIVRTPTPVIRTPTPTDSSTLVVSGTKVTDSQSETVSVTVPKSPVKEVSSPTSEGGTDWRAAEEEAMQLLEDVIDEHHTLNDSIISTGSSKDSAPSTKASDVTVNKPAGEVTICDSSVLEQESNTDESVTVVGEPSEHISVVPVSVRSDDTVTIEGTTQEDTDVDSLIQAKVSSPASDSSSTSDSGRGNSPQLTNGGSMHSPTNTLVTPTSTSKLEDRSDSDSVSTVSSEKENARPSKTRENGEVLLRRKEGIDRSESTETTASIASTASTTAPSNPRSHSRAGRTKDELESMALKRKTRKRTRKFMLDGVVVTTTTSKVIYGDDEDGNIMASGHLARKQELRELKILQKLEQKQFQELGIKAGVARQDQERKFEAEKAQLLRSYDTDVDTLNRHQKQQVERAESQQEIELKQASKKIRSDQEKELRSFRDSLKTEHKLLKQEVDLMPKDLRKESLRKRKEQLDADQQEREKAFVERLHQSHETSMKRLSEEHRCRVALLEKQFLQKKHQLLRAREAALWELEERHLHDRNQLAKRQLKDIFFLQRHQMLLRHEKELEQVRRQNSVREEELVKRQAVERRHMPKRIRQEMKARELMFRESMRISTAHLSESQQDEKDRLRKFQECEKRRYEAEKKRGEQKHKRQLEELQALIEAQAKELEQMQNEKRKMLMEHETMKLKAQEEEYQKELREWKNNLKPRKQRLEEEFDQQLAEQEQFYGAYLSEGTSGLMKTLPPTQ